MADITLKGNVVHTVGELPSIGSLAPDFRLVKADLSEATLNDYKGKKVILNIFPSIDTGTCALSVKQFNEKASKLDGVEVLCISQDLPFAQGRFCGAENIEHVTTLSGFRSPEFGQNYGTLLLDGPLQGLQSRAIVIVDETGKVIYTQQVQEIVDEPDYDKALSAL